MQKLKILIVEDKEQGSVNVKNSLSELDAERFEYIEVDGGINLMKILEESVPDLIILDIIMKEMRFIYK